MKITPVLAMHGGAGPIVRDDPDSPSAEEYREALKSIRDAAYGVLEKHGSAMDAVTLAVSLLEDNPLFNAGRGAVYTREGTHELEASIMDGVTREAGAVIALRHVKNPVRAARFIKESSEHMCMEGGHAEAFLKENGFEMVPQSYFDTPRRRAQLDKFLAENPAAIKLGKKAWDAMGTVGAVALDCGGRLAAATSTGGRTGKRAGRVGDTPVLGAGCYADNIAAISCTGTGEVFMRLVLAKDIADRIRYGQATLAEAAEKAIAELGRLGGSGGLVAVDESGDIAMPMNAGGMYRACVRKDGSRYAAVYRDE